MYLNFKNMLFAKADNENMHFSRIIRCTFLKDNSILIRIS